MSPADWKDALGALRAAMPDPEETPQDVASGKTADQDDAHGKGAAGRSRGRVNIALEKKGRGGKTATILYGFSIPDEEIAELAKILKQRLAAGGSARGGEILLQGDCRAKVAEILRQLNFKVN